jgi:molybdopterin molybdotransferase
MRPLAEILSATPGYKPDGLSLAQARTVMRAFVDLACPEERVPLRAALGRVLAEAVLAGFDVPDHPVSAMDGWAIRSKDLQPGGETPLAEIGTSFAGHPFAGDVGAGQCVRIMTGAVVPAGADTVVMQEEVRSSDAKVVIPAGQKAGQNCRPAGEDMKKGQVALREGSLLTPAAIGVAASLGFGTLTVRRRLRVAFFSSGDELTVLGEPLSAGQVYDSNRHTLWAMLTRLNVETIDLGVVRDDPEALERALREGAARADAIVTTGGAAEGEADFTRRIAAGLGEVAFWKLALRPGRPFAFGRIDSGRIDSGERHAVFFGLPGNPVAAIVGFYRLVQPTLKLMMGLDDAEPPTFKAHALEPMKKRVGREEYQRGVLLRAPDGSWCVRLAGAQGSANVVSMAEANCLIALPAELGEVKAGDWVDVMLMESIA